MLVFWNIAWTETSIFQLAWKKQCSKKKKKWKKKREGEKPLLVDSTHRLSLLFRGRIKLNYPIKVMSCFGMGSISHMPSNRKLWLFLLPFYHYFLPGKLQFSSQPLGKCQFPVCLVLCPASSLCSASDMTHTWKFKGLYWPFYPQWKKKFIINS